MATEIVTRVLCDFCAADDVETADANTLAVSINGTSFEVDVCGPHRKPLDDLAETLAEHGRKIPKSASAGNGKKPASATSQPQVCPSCGETYANKGSLQSHCRDQHGKTLAELLGAPADHKCEWCDRAFTTPQGVAVHEQRAHPIDYAERKAAQESA